MTWNSHLQKSVLMLIFCSEPEHEQREGGRVEATGEKLWSLQNDAKWFDWIVLLHYQSSSFHKHKCHILGWIFLFCWFTVDPQKESCSYWNDFQPFNRLNNIKSSNFFRFWGLKCVPNIHETD